MYNYEVIAEVVNLCKTLGIPIPSKAGTIGRLGELIVYKRYLEVGLKVIPLFLIDPYSTHDLLVNGKRVEVKASSKSVGGKYCFILKKNFKDRVALFDEVAFVFLEEVGKDPEILRVSAEKIDSFAGYRGTKDYFFQKFTP